MTQGKVTSAADVGGKMTSGQDSTEGCSCLHEVLLTVWAGPLLGTSPLLTCGRGLCSVPPLLSAEYSFLLGCVPRRKSASFSTQRGRLFPMEVVPPGRDPPHLEVLMSACFGRGSRNGNQFSFLENRPEVFLSPNRCFC